ncbi:MAG: zinc ABC transporter substrate-binding protein [Planctomycetes bacterium]|nr:zinc ABC transporter substrate-binding protein [Planctomycetota bacterium]
MLRYLIMGLVLFSCSITGCKRVDEGMPRPDLSNRKARVVTTTGMIADIVKEVGGDLVEIDCLLGPASDPHKYYPTSGDTDRLGKADLILYNGLELEAKMGEVFEKNSKKIRTVAVARKLEPSDLRTPEPGFEGTHDPHIWFNVKYWMKAVDAVQEALVDLDPKNADTYNARAKAYQKKLEELDREIHQEVAKIDQKKRVIITAHDAFGYFGDAYGFQVKGLQGTSTATQAGTRSVQDLVKIIGEQRIPVIFGETSVPDAGIEAVLEAVAKQYKDVKVKLCEERLFSDALGEPGTPEGTYIGMVRHNVRTIVNALSAK